MFKLNFFIAVFIWTSQLFALPEAVRLLAKMEVGSNAASQRSHAPVEMPHYEIPLSLLIESKHFDLDSKIYQSLVFEKNGQKFVRWVVNPEDTLWFKDVEKFMLEKGLIPERKFYFTGYQTASRSYIVEDPEKTIQFSIKGSTDKTGGSWKDKKQPLSDGEDAIRISEMIARAEAAMPFKNIVIMKEPLLFGIGSIDQAIVVRELGSLAKTEKYFYIPGFSVLHEKAGKDIALKNGSDDPYKFWTDHYIAPMGRAAAELVSRTGIWFDSPHGQNFLVELDQEFKPTGRIVMRDLSDVTLSKDIINALGEGRLAREFSEQSNILGNMRTSFGPLHGNKPPTWISQTQYNAWGTVYRNAFRDNLAQMSGIATRDLNITLSKSSFSYYSIETTAHATGWAEWVSFLNQITVPMKFCSRLFGN